MHDTISSHSFGLGTGFEKLWRGTTLPTRLDYLAREDTVKETVKTVQHLDVCRTIAGTHKLTHKAAAQTRVSFKIVASITSDNFHMEC